VLPMLECARLALPHRRRSSLSRVFLFSSRPPTARQVWPVQRNRQQDPGAERMARREGPKPLAISLWLPPRREAALVLAQRLAVRVGREA
jgi:hypothetical protein